MTTEVAEDTFDVVVVGGGLAGLCAAIAASRHGAKTALLQDRPVLGGNSSNEIRVSITGASAGGRNPFCRESGIIEELLIEDRFRASTPYPVNGEPRPDWDWLLYEWAIKEENLLVLLNTTAIEPVMDAESHSILAVRARQHGSDQEMLLHGTYFVDASGDGDVAAKAGAQFRYGREGKLDTKESLAPLRGDKQVLGSSLMFSARNTGHPVKFTPPAWAYTYTDEKELSYREHDRVTEGYWWIEWGGNKNTIADNDEIRDELLKMVYGVWDHIKNHGSHKAEYLALDWVGSVVGKRESRRFLGDYVLKQEDVEHRPLFADACAYGGWPMDIHPVEGMKARELPCIQIYPPGPYNIPLRSLYSKDVPNLFLAGRNISATHMGFASTRVMGTCSVIGQAVGTAAALCLQHECVPSELASRYPHELQQRLLKDDCFIVGVRADDDADLLRRAKVTESSHQGPFEVTTFERMIPLDETRAQMFAVSEPYLERFSVYLESTAKTDLTVKATLYKASHVYDFTSTEVIAAAVVTMPAGKRSWVAFPFQVPVEPGSCYWVSLDEAKGIAWGSIDSSVLGAVRAERMSFRKLWLPRAGCHTFRLTPQSWPFAGRNVINGATRPAFGPSLWISSGQERLPQSVELELPDEVELDTVYLTFDTNLDKLVPFGPAPECVRDYKLSYYDGARWRDLFEERGNHQRRRRHEFAAIRTSALKLTVLATNGAASARVYEMRAYLERPAPVVVEETTVVAEEATVAESAPPEEPTSPDIEQTAIEEPALAGEDLASAQ